MRENPLTKRDKERIRYIYMNTELSQAKIGEIFNVSQSYIGSIINNKVYEKTNHRRILTKDERYKIYELRCKGIQGKAIAEIFSIHVDTVYSVYRRVCNEIANDPDNLEEKSEGVGR